MASLYAPILTYDPITNPQATQATHYQLEHSPGNGFIYEAITNPVIGITTSCYHSDSLIIATAGQHTHCLRRHARQAPTDAGGARRQEHLAAVAMSWLFISRDEMQVEETQ